MIQIAPAVKHHLLDTFFFGPLRDQLPNLFGRRQVPARLLLALGLLATRRRGGHKSHAIAVVNELGVDMIQRAINIEARTPLTALKPLANASVNPSPYCIFRNLRDHVSYFGSISAAASFPSQRTLAPR